MHGGVEVVLCCDQHHLFEVKFELLVHVDKGEADKVAQELVPAFLGQNMDYAFPAFICLKWVDVEPLDKRYQLSPSIEVGEPIDNPRDIVGEGIARPGKDDPFIENFECFKFEFSFQFLGGVDRQPS